MEMEKIIFFILFLFVIGVGLWYNCSYKEGIQMKHFISIAILSLLVCGAQAAQNGRATMAGKTVMSAPRATASINQLNGMGAPVANNVPTDQIPSADPIKPAQEEVDRREAERNACINNNIGIGNTFVWASRNSDTSNYAAMMEDVNNPKNNVCFVRVELKSDDESRVSVSDIPAKYFIWGENIECGSWVNEKDMEKRILDAKKGARIGGIVASTVGGAGLGVGVMEAFGNKAIGGKVQGQKALEGAQLYRSKLLVYKEKNITEYNRIVNALKVLKEAGTTDSIGGVDYASYKPLIDEFAN